MNRHRRTPRPPHRRPRSPLRRLSLRIALRAAIGPRPLRPRGFPQLPRCFSRPLLPQCRRLGCPPRAPWRRPRGRAGRVGARPAGPSRPPPGCPSRRPGAWRSSKRARDPSCRGPLCRLRPPPAPGLRFALAPEDFRIQCYETRAATTTLFVVDASGSAALQRLGEAKGAVEAMLADSYARRDEVAMVIFRGEHTDLVLPPTRALVRARRALAGVPGGGATPLGEGRAARHYPGPGHRTPGAPAWWCSLPTGGAISP